MISVDYQLTREVLAKSTFDFLMNRPIVRAINYFMKLSCLILCVGFAVSAYYGNARPKDYAAVVSAIIWLTNYKRIHYWVINKSLKKRNMDTMRQSFNIDRQKIFYKTNHNHPMNIEWKKVRFLLKKKDGYILPVSGFANAGKFLWVPFDGFVDKDGKTQFEELIKKIKVKVKDITSD